MDDKLVVVSVDVAELTDIVGGAGTPFFADTKWKRHQKTWSNHVVKVHVATTLLVKKMVKKKHQQRKNSRSQQKQYNTIKFCWPVSLTCFFLVAAAALMVDNVNFVMLSYDRCCVIVLVFLKIERKLRTTKKSVKWFVLTPLHTKKTFGSVNVPKSYVCYILLWKFGKSQLQVQHQNSSQLYHNIFTPIKHGAIKETQNQHCNEDRHQQRS